MLFECSCEATRDLIDEAFNKSIALEPRANTPLVELVKNTTIAPITDLTAKLGEDLKAIPVGVMQEQSNNSMHNSWMDEIVNRSSDIINRRIDNIKGTVIPVIRSIGEAVLSDVANIESHEIVGNIYRYVACDVINIDSFMNDVKKNTPGKYLSPSKYFNEDNLPLEQIVELLKTGSKTFDEALTVAINRVGGDNLFVLWESLFVDRSKISIDNYRTFDEFIINPSIGLDYAILVYQLATKVQANDPEAAKEYKEAAASYISLYSANYQRDVAACKVIRNRRNNKGEIEVNAIAYTAFLQRGGNVEMIIGAAANQKYYSFADDILKNSEEVLKDYRLLRSANSLETRKRLTNITKDSLRTHFMHSFGREQSDVEQAYYEANPGAASSAIAKFERALDYVSHTTTQDLFRQVTKILCDTRFAYFDCYSFLQLIDLLHEEGLTPAEALTQATLQEICGFVVSQIKIR